MESGPGVSHFGTGHGLRDVSNVATAAAATGRANTLDEALRQARLTEAAHHEAVLGIKDAKSLRLQVLKDDIAAVIAHSQEARQMFDLALAPGEPPKLWIDLITFVVMEPDYQTYRLVQDNHAGREILLETADRPEMVETAQTLYGAPDHRPRTPDGGNAPGRAAGRIRRQRPDSRRALWLRACHSDRVNLRYPIGNIEILMVPAAVTFCNTI